MILIINTCKEKLHYFEFVKPIEEIAKNINEFKTIHYNDLKESDIEKADKVIICGTSLKDNQFIKDIEKFSWIKNFNKPLLGICSGMQIISLIFGAELKKHSEIGLLFDHFKNEFACIFEIDSVEETYHLHNNYTTLPKDFECLDEYPEEISHAIKHSSKQIYGVLFHPEVRQEEIIINFLKLN